MTFVGKQGTGFACIKFSVLVIGLTRLKIQTLNNASFCAPFSFECRTFRLHANGHLVFSHSSIITLVSVHRQAQIATVKEHTGANCSPLSLAGRVTNAGGQLRRSWLVASQILWHFDVAGATIKRIGMKHPIALPNFQHSAVRTLAITRSQLGLGFTSQALHFLTRNAVVNDVNHASNGASAILQCRGTTQYFDALCA